MHPTHRPWLRHALMFIDTPDSDGGGATPATDEDGGGDEQQQTPAKPADTTKPSDTVDFWKRKARENEKRAKDNADAAQRLQAIEDRDKSEQQRAADALAKAERAAADAVADAARYKAAATHGVTGDDIDLIGGSDEDTVMARAARIGQLLADSRELAELRSRSERGPATGRPQPALRPGVTPVEVDMKPTARDSIADLVASRGWNKEALQQ